MAISDYRGYCAGCGKLWNPLRQAHCKGCHEHFNSDVAFDRHREGPIEARYCVPVEDFSKPYRKSGKPRLVQAGRADGLVWVTALRDSGNASNED